MENFNSVGTVNHNNNICKNDQMIVIGAGLPRTGTTSTKRALEELLSGKCYHMEEVVFGAQTENERHFWELALEDHARPKKLKVLTERDWINFLPGRGFKAGVDYPISLVYKELMEVFPDAKVVLTVRDSPEAWWRSVKETIYIFSHLPLQFHIRIFQKIVGLYDPVVTAARIARYPANGFETGMYGSIEKGPEESAKFYNSWTEEVVRSVPVDRLLVFNVKQGWKPLCDFLDLPVPTTPFPHANDTQYFKTVINRVKVSAFVAVYVVPAGIALAGYLFGESLVNTFRSILNV